MKFTLLHLFPFRDLPSGFRDEHPGVTVDVPSRYFDASTTQRAYEESLDELELAASLGFDGIAIGEHHQDVARLTPGPHLLAGALARRTRHVAIVLLGTDIALYGSPVRVAEELAMLDCLSGGRIVAGFALGSGDETAYARGENPVLLRARFAEAESLIRRAWSEPGPFLFNGRFTQSRYINPWPRPLQQPHPPIWLLDDGSVEMRDHAVASDAGYAVLSFDGHPVSERRLDSFRAALREAGKFANPFQAMAAQVVCCAATESEAEDRFAAHAELFAGTMLRTWDGYRHPPGYYSMASIVAQGAAAGMPNRVRPPSWKELVESGVVIAGTPRQVAERLEATIRRLTVGHLAIVGQVGDMPHALACESIRLIAREVLPSLRGIWEGEGHEDRWWPGVAGGQQ